MKFHLLDRMNKQPSQEFMQAAKQIAETDGRVALTTRKLLSHFGYERRGSKAIKAINYWLKRLELETDPTLSRAGFDGTIYIVRRQKRGRGRPRVISPVMHNAESSARLSKQDFTAGDFTSGRQPDNIIAALEILLEQVDQEATRQEEHGAEALRNRDRAAAKTAIDIAEKIDGFRVKVKLLHDEWRGLLLGPTKSQRMHRHPRRKNYGRLNRNVSTGQNAFYRPILQILSERGGQAPMVEVLDEIRRRLDQTLSSIDREILPSGKEVRWRKTAQWARNALRDQGYLASNSPRGVWEITEAGRLWAKSLTSETTKLPHNV